MYSHYCQVKFPSGWFRGFNLINNMLKRDKKLNLDVGRKYKVTFPCTFTCHFSPSLKDCRRLTVNGSATWDFFVTRASFDWEIVWWFPFLPSLKIQKSKKTKR